MALDWGGQETLLLHPECLQRLEALIHSVKWVCLPRPWVPRCSSRGPICSSVYKVEALAQKPTQETLPESQANVLQHVLTAGHAGGLTAGDPGEGLPLNWQDMALGDHNILPSSQSDRGLLFAWALDQMLPQSRDTLFSRLKAKTNRQTGQGDSVQRALGQQLLSASDSLSTGHGLQYHWWALNPLIFRAALGGCYSFIIVPLWYMRLRFRDTKLTPTPQVTQNWRRQDFNQHCLK